MQPPIALVPIKVRWIKMKYDAKLAIWEPNGTYYVSNINAVILFIRKDNYVEFLLVLKPSSFRHLHILGRTMSLWNNI